MLFANYPKTPEEEKTRNEPKQASVFPHYAQRKTGLASEGPDFRAAVVPKRQVKPLTCSDSLDAYLNTCFCLKTSAV